MSGMMERYLNRRLNKVALVLWFIGCFTLYVILNDKINEDTKVKYYSVIGCSVVAYIVLVAIM